MTNLSRKLIGVQIKGTVSLEGHRFLDRITVVMILMDSHAFDAVVSTLEPPLSSAPRG